MAALIYMTQVRVMSKSHEYKSRLVWNGNLGAGTETYQGYGRDYSISIEGKPDLHGSADPMFRGDPGKHNPEDLLVAALSSCHLLTYLALCARARIKVTSYRDNASGTMITTPDGGGHFTEVVLRPEVIVAEEGMLEKAERFHQAAQKYCFISSSVNFPVRHEARCIVAGR